MIKLQQLISTIIENYCNSMSRGYNETNKSSVISYLNSIRDESVNVEKEINEYRTILEIIHNNSNDSLIKNISKEVLDKYKTND